MHPFSLVAVRSVVSLYSHCISEECLLDCEMHGGKGYIEKLKLPSGDIYPGPAYSTIF